MSEAVTDVPKDLEPTNSRRRQLLIVLVVLLVAVAIGTWWALRQPSSPTLLGDRTVVGFDSDPRPVSAAAGFAGLAMPGPGPDEVLTFNGVPSIRFRTNTAEATARVAVCVSAHGGPVLASSLSDLDTACREVRYVENGTHLRWGDTGDDGPREYLILVVTPSKAGVATVDQVTYDYERESGESGLDVGSVGYTIRAT